MADEIARNVARLTAEADFIISGCERGEITGKADSCDHDRCAGSRRKNGRTTCGFKVTGDRVAYETLMEKPLSRFELFGSAVEYASRPSIPHTPPLPHSSPTPPPSAHATSPSSLVRADATVLSCDLRGLFESNNAVGGPVPLFRDRWPLAHDCIASVRGQEARRKGHTHWAVALAADCSKSRAGLLDRDASVTGRAVVLNGIALELLDADQPAAKPLGRLVVVNQRATEACEQHKSPTLHCVSVEGPEAPKMMELVKGTPRALLAHLPQFRRNPAESQRRAHHLRTVHRAQAR